MRSLYFYKEDSNMTFTSFVPWKYNINVYQNGFHQSIINTIVRKLLFKPSECHCFPKIWIYLSFSKRIRRREIELKRLYLQ